MGEQILVSSGTSFFNIINPIIDTQIELQIKKSDINGTNPIIYGVVIEYDIFSSNYDDRISISLSNYKIAASSIIYQPAAYIPWLIYRHGYYTSGILIYQTIIVDRYIDIRL